MKGQLKADGGLIGHIYGYIEKKGEKGEGEGQCRFSFVCDFV